MRLSLVIGALFFIMNLAVANTLSWAQITQEDLQAIHDDLKANCPGALDKSNPSFRTWLETGLKQGFARAKLATTYSDYYFTLREYTNGFHDEHIIPNAQWNDRITAIRYPGFLTQYRHHHFYITNVKNTLQPKNYIGAELLSCGNESLHDRMINQVLAYWGNPNLSADWIHYAGFLMVAFPHMNDQPKSCRVLYLGKVHEITLHWQPLVSQDVNQLIRTIPYPSTPPFSIRPFMTSGLWISVPFFYFNHRPIHLNAMKTIIKKINQQQEASPVVFDLRGNFGGNSSWGTRMLVALYGADTIRKLVRCPLLKTYTMWRVSPHNLHVLQNNYLPMLARNQGEKSQQYMIYQRITEAMQVAYQQQKKWLRNRIDLATATAQCDAIQLPKRHFPKVYLVTDGRCSSSCLTFVSQALRLPHVIQVGMPTSAMTNYAEVATIGLSNQFTELHYPMKLTVNRGFASNQPFIPSWQYEGNINDTAGLQRWLAEKIKQQ